MKAFLPKSVSCLLVATAMVTAGAGCAGRADSIAAARKRSRAMLASARVNNISFFGQPPAPADPSFSNRTLISATQHTFSEVGADFDVDVDPTGTRLAFASTRHSLEPDLYWKTVDGVAITQLTSDPASDIQPAFSPDGSRVAFASNRTGNWDIWMMATGGGPAVQITRGIADDVHPSWSPDGSKLVYGSLPPDGGPGQLWISDAVAGGSARFIGYGLFPDWSPTGNIIVFQRARERESRWFSIWTLELIDGEPRYPTEVAADVSNAMIQPNFSHDGKRIVFAGTPSVPMSDVYREALLAPPYDIWVMNADGRNRIRLTDGFTANYAPTFSADGRIFFTSDRSGHENIWSLTSPEVMTTTTQVANERTIMTTTAMGAGVRGN